MSLQSYFPHPYMRDKQEKILGEIEQAIKSGFKNIFLEAPAGFGKSPVAIALARYLGSSHICTATKDLQAQYSRDFPFIREVKGKSNFICIIKDEMGLDETCNYGPCLKDDGYDCIYKTKLGDYKVQGEGTKYETVELDHFAQKKYIDKMKSQSRIIQFDWKPCHYYHQKWIALKSSHTIYNYKYFLSDLFYSNNIQKRQLLVLDEAHTVESEVADFKSFAIFNEGIASFLPKLSIPYEKEYDIETWIAFGTELREKLLIFIDKASTILEKNIEQYPFTEKNLIDAITKEKNLTTVIEDMRSNKDNWIVTNIEKAANNQLRKVLVTPIDVSSYFKDILDKGSISLFMSATILSKDYLCKIGGIKSDQVKFIRVHESNFPLKNRPIYLMNVAWLNAKTMNQSLPAIANAVNNIMTTHKNEKGIIHTTSYSQLRFIKENISKENAIRLIETGSKFDRNEMLEKHYKSSKPTVIISPSLYLGVDLKDNLSRFQIIVKVPYADLTDRKISVMKQRDPNWYIWNAILKLVQAYGRSIRSKEDFANTYILDSSITFLLKQAKEMSPKWFSDAIIQR
ncbi:MAG TPA: helicase C-terminal domain-containing protein [Nitrososphaeraceae archaeon]|nr:helicase C-terminal domain-containing protein [Nitrososphaeraceae archaeon]